MSTMSVTLDILILMFSADVFGLGNAIFTQEDELETRCWSLDVFDVPSSGTETSSTMLITERFAGESTSENSRSKIDAARQTLETNPQDVNVARVYVDESTQDEGILQQHPPFPDQGVGFRYIVSQWRATVPGEWSVLRSYDFATTLPSRYTARIYGDRPLFGTKRDPDLEWVRLVRRLAMDEDENGNFKGAKHSLAYSKYY